MRLIVFLIPLLCGCATPVLHCDSNLQPINAPAANHVPGAASAKSSSEKQP
jgi:hypothetical protein